MSALKSRSHPEAPARLALSLILLLIDCLCVSVSLVCLGFLMTCEISLSLFLTCLLTIGSFSLSAILRCLKGSHDSITPLFLDSYTLYSLYPSGNLDEKKVQHRPRNKAKGEIIPESLCA